MSETTREVRLVARPVGEPVPSDFELVEVPVGEPGSGEILVRNTWMSVDPYMRGRMNDVKSYVPPYRLGEPMEGGAVGEVVASNAANIPVGATVLHSRGWREVAIVPETSAQVVDTGLAPARTYLGALGMVGLTAYAGLVRIAPVEEGDVVFISGAAGAVGIIAGRVARHLGAAKVVGSAGGPVKTRRLVEEFGYDAAIDYRLGDIEGQLATAAPEGVDVYFDNVGGDHLRAALAAMNPDGRIALCGAVSAYNEAEPPPGPDNLFLAVGKRLTLRGFIVGYHRDLAPEYARLAAGWLADGSLRYSETVVDGIGNAVDAFLGMLRGANTGKMLVRLTDRE
ncbi:NADP-dependent oxidoreductase [Actinomadura atramentaria]|uniref:NADP-dependent oxidoreductase n=1 Tax=Actinomadura atramentaria TaxID=1990 RepID=UPI0003A0364F|nr:NADP-dependent oxidoreductase [Actinomadura atramentaria]